jgi:hypothetical protein
VDKYKHNSVVSQELTHIFDEVYNQIFADRFNTVVLKWLLRDGVVHDSSSWSPEDRINTLHMRTVYGCTV